MQGEDKYLKSVRKQTVAKRTDFIQKSRYSLTNVENKAVLYILSKYSRMTSLERDTVFTLMSFIR